MGTYSRTPTRSPLYQQYSRGSDFTSERMYYFLEKENYQAYGKLFLLLLVSVQFSLRKRKHILS